MSVIFLKEYKNNLDISKAKDIEVYRDGNGFISLLRFNINDNTYEINDSIYIDSYYDAFKKYKKIDIYNDNKNIIVYDVNNYNFIGHNNHPQSIDFDYNKVEVLECVYDIDKNEYLFLDYIYNGKSYALFEHNKILSFCNELYIETGKKIDDICKVDRVRASESTNESIKENRIESDEKINKNMSSKEVSYMERDENSLKEFYEEEMANFVINHFPKHFVDLVVRYLPYIVWNNEHSDIIVDAGRIYTGQDREEYFRLLNEKDNEIVNVEEVSNNENNKTDNNIFVPINNVSEDINNDNKGNESVVIAPVIDNNESNKKNKKGVVVKRICAGLTAIILAGAGHHICKGNNPFNGGKIIGDRIVDTIDYDDSTKDKDYVIQINNAVNNQEEVCRFFRNLSNGAKCTESDLFNYLNEFSAVSNSNTSELGDFIKGKKLTGDKYYINFENIFENNSREYFAVKEICEYRNNCIDSSYVNNSKDSTIYNIKRFFDFYNDFVYNGATINYEYNGRNYYTSFEELNIVAQHCIVQLGLYMNTIDIGKYSYNGHNLKDYRNKVEDMASGIMDGLFNDYVIRTK